MMVLKKSLGRMADIIARSTDFETNFNATHSKPFTMLDALLWLMLLVPHAVCSAVQWLPREDAFSNGFLLI